MQNDFLIYYIVTKSSIVDDLWVRDLPLVCFFSVRKIKKEEQKEKVKKKSSTTRCEICPKLTIKTPKRR